MENVFGIIVVLIGVYLKFNSDSDLSTIKAYSAMAGGITYLGLNNWPLVKSYFSKVTKKNNPEQIFSPKEYELHDTNCLIHLRNRCIENGSKEGIETCAKLNAIMFGFKKVDKENEPVVDKTL